MSPIPIYWLINFRVRNKISKKMRTLVKKPFLISSPGNGISEYMVHESNQTVTVKRSLMGKKL